MFLRPKLKIPSRYLEILYFAVPVMAALIQFATLTGIAGSGGYCSAFEPYQPGTKSFTVFVVCAYLLLPGLCLLYNLVTVTRVVLLLLRKQSEISKTLSKISAESQALLSNGRDDGKGRAKMRHEEQRLKAARNVYNAAIRIRPVPNCTAGMVLLQHRVLPHPVPPHHDIQERHLKVCHDAADGVVLAGDYRVCQLCGLCQRSLGCPRSSGK
ncbi:hypothetical protein DL89DRAFT_130134 [Linderina pennispora]|uniref:Uncharacterized protein n=1 Tax=Linderina pennispora TaxID=61395 RepID=A0A1Y1WE98_9FUNG|nr:uncharacterized protein DL89DRAFT_130134 [Linderina pennispora]ORX71658.1 hypothetical protein DL89DRAFT_130134 [Linderina pennispora]